MVDEIANYRKSTGTYFSTTLVSFADCVRGGVCFAAETDVDDLNWLRPGVVGTVGGGGRFSSPGEPMLVDDRVRLRVGRVGVVGRDLALAVGVTVRGATGVVGRAVLGFLPLPVPLSVGVVDDAPTRRALEVIAVVTTDSLAAGMSFLALCFLKLGSCLRGNISAMEVGAGEATAGVAVSEGGSLASTSSSPGTSSSGSGETMRRLFAHLMTFCPRM